MNRALILLAIASVAVGLLLGGIIVFVLFIYRQKITISSSIGDPHLAGRVGIVTVPFDYRSKGKISLQIEGSTREMIAVTDQPYAFSSGDQALVIQVHNTQVWVIPASYLEADFSS
ncbi:MAG: hypothetical protein ICV77_07290 [Cyanobacteria bacterium Co-bin8]|nr:hypothetical protein [Cyanobacteria bacterium Co-bin8]